jgi:hypothetical protein
MDERNERGRRSRREEQTHTYMHKADHKSGAYSLNKSPSRKEKDDDGIEKNYYDLDDRID